MQKNELPSNTLPLCRTPELDVRPPYLNELPPLKTSSEALTSPGANRDSGIFEDLVPLHLKDDFTLEDYSPSRDYFCFDHRSTHSDKTLDEDLNLTSNSDRFLHASLSSLNTEVDLSPSLSSLSFDSSTEEEEEDSEEEEEGGEILKRAKEEEEGSEEEREELIEKVEEESEESEDDEEREVVERTKEIEEESEEEREELVEKVKEEEESEEDEESEVVDLAKEEEEEDSEEEEEEEEEEEFVAKVKEEEESEEDEERVADKSKEKEEESEEEKESEAEEDREELVERATEEEKSVEDEEEELIERTQEEEESEEEEIEVDRSKEEEESEEPEEEREEEIIEGEEEEEEYEELVSNNETSISSESEDLSLSESDSSSFGYHSLLNDATPDEGNIFSSDTDKLNENEDSDNEIPFDKTKPTLISSSEYQEYDSSSLDLSDIENLSASKQIPAEEEEEEEEAKESESNLNKEDSLSSLSLSVSTSSLSSEDESPSDIENKMAETEVKMNDSRLSNGREELSIHTRKMKHYMKTKDLQNVLGDVPSHRLTYKDKSFAKNNVLYNNNNNNNNYKQLLNHSRAVDKQRFRPPSSLPLKNKIAEQDNRMSTSEDSPIIDAYEKECQDAPEKSVREVEKQGKTKKNEEMLQEKCRSEIEAQDEADMKAFEAAMKRAIQKKEAESHSLTNTTFDFDDVELRHRPSPQQRRRERNALRRSVPQASNSLRDRNKHQKSPDVGEFDVYTMETALPKIDWEAIEAHLLATKEEEKRRRTDREEIRRKLAMGTDEEAFNDGISKKPSLQSRLQSGKNLQICFMNETASDCESQCSDTESTQDRIDEMEGIINYKDASKLTESDIQSMDFVTRQAKLQAEARLALSQAKEMARMQMEIEKQSQKKSPITEIIKDSFNKIGFPFPAGKRRMSRQLLSDMNVAQLQVIVNDFHTQIEILNEDLVQLLLNRDDLHMEQDSMLVDIEDLTKHLGAKQGPNAILNSNGMSKSLPATNHRKFSHSTVIPTRSLKLRSAVQTAKK